MACNLLETHPGISKSSVAFTVNGDGTATYDDGTIIQVHPDTQLGHHQGVRTEVRSGQWLVFRKDSFPSNETTEKKAIEAAEAARDKHRKRLHLRVRERVSASITEGPAPMRVAGIRHIRSGRRGYHRR